MCITIRIQNIMHMCCIVAPTLTVYVNILWWNYSSRKQVEEEIKQMYSLAANCQIFKHW